VADLSLASSAGLGGQLRQILDQEDLLPGDEPSYQVCKALFLFHPLGQKMTELPVALAQTQEREVKAPGPDVVAEAFRDEWKALGATRTIRNVKTQSRIYGLASVGLLSEGTPPDRPVNLKALYDTNIAFNVWDPLNTTGVIVDQDPNSMRFQKHGDLRVGNSTVYHRSRTRTVMNEESIYIAWTSSAYAYAGRSVYQRGFFPLKSFLNTMLVDEFVARKAGLLVAKMESPGSIIDSVMQQMFGIKRALLKAAHTFGVLSIGVTEAIETLNMQNVDGAYGMARDNIVKNIATSTPMPAKLLTEEAFVLGFGEGTEDSKHIAQYLDGVRIEMDPIYGWFDEIVQHRAWNAEWYETIQKAYPENYASKTHAQAFYEWRKGFTATWPNLLKEPESELAEVDEIKLRAAINMIQVLAPLVDPESMADVIAWLVDQVNSKEALFTSTLNLDFGRIKDFLIDKDEQAQEMATMGGEEGGEEGGAKSIAEQEHVMTPPKPAGLADSAGVAKVLEWTASNSISSDRRRAISALRAGG
jgi:hypothetical protein